MIPRARPAGLNRLNFFGVAGYHAALAALLPFYLSTHGAPGWPLAAWTAGLAVWVGLGVTAGYHRLWSHRAWTAAWPVRFLLMLGGTLAMESDVVKWSHDHRFHHRFTDRDGDPYDARKGFWYSHLLWVFEKDAPYDSSVVADLSCDPMLRWQRNNYLALLVGLNALVCAGVGFATGDWLGALVFAVLVRTFFTHHTTFFINSLAHMWGSRPYSRAHSAVDSWWLALLTYGEGYHNFHHTFPSDYRNGVRAWQWDPTKWLIWALSRVGLAAGLKRTCAWRVRASCLEEARRYVLQRLERAGESAQQLRARVTEAYERAAAALARAQELSGNAQALRGAARETAARWKTEYAQAQVRAYEAWEEWSAAYRTVLKAA